MFLAVGEKRKASELLNHEENKRPRVMGDISLELINEVMATITDPAAVAEVTFNHTTTINYMSYVL